MRTARCRSRRARWPVAGVKKWAHAHRATGKALVAICSGANVNFDRLRHIAERAEIGDSHETLLAVTIPEKPGSFKRFLGHLGRRTVTSSTTATPPRRRRTSSSGIKLGDDPAEAPNSAAPHPRRRLPGDGSHRQRDGQGARALHGRRPLSRPGRRDAAALSSFPRARRVPGFSRRPSAAAGTISLFHYRNHGAAYGRVLAGLQGADAPIAPNVSGPWTRSAMTTREENRQPRSRLFLGTEPPAPPSQLGGLVRQQALVLARGAWPCT